MTLPARIRSLLSHAASGAASRRVIGATFLAVLAADLALSAALLYQQQRPRDLYYVPAADRVGRVRADTMTVDHVRAFAEHYITHLEDFTPTTVAWQTAYVLSFMAKDMVDEAGDAVIARARSTRDNGISSLFVVVPQRTRAEELSDRWVVTLTAYKEIYAYGRRIEQGVVEYRLELRVGPVKKTNPYGLYVSHQGFTRIAADMTVPPIETDAQRAAEQLGLDEDPQMDFLERWADRKRKEGR